MTDIDRDREHFRALLDSYIADAIAAHPRPIRRRLRALVDAGAYRVSTRFHLDADDQPIPRTLTYVVAVPVNDADGAVGWAELVTVHWPLLELAWEHVVSEVELSIRRREAGDPCIEIVRPEH